MIRLNRQQTKILQILRVCKDMGMNSYSYRMQFIQLPARIKDLRKMGFIIQSRENQNRSVNYILQMEPSEPIGLWGVPAVVVRPIEHIRPLQMVFF